MGYLFGAGTGLSIEDLMQRRDEAREHFEVSGMPQNAAQGLYQLGTALMGRVARNRINERINELDPKGEIVRAIMEGRNG